MEVGAFSISSFSGIPLCTRLFEDLFSKVNQSGSILVTHCDLVNTVQYSERVIQRPLKSFRTYQSFRRQSRLFKITKYVSIFSALLCFAFLKKGPVFYTIDSNTCLLALFVKKLFFFKRIKIIYHQFEMDVPEFKTKIDKCFFVGVRHFSMALDLVVVPEINRLNFLRKIVHIEHQKCMVFPNTTRLNYKPRSSGKRIIFGHVGGLGLEHHYIEPFLNVFSRLSVNAEVELMIIGNISDEVRSLVVEFALPNVTLIGAVPHHELMEFYNKIDFGLILYRPVDINNIYCAPNKLYEFWSCGIPVIAPRLEGLIPLYSQPFLGRLVDMEDTLLFSDQLAQCINTKELYDPMKIAKHFKEHLQIDNYLNLLTEALNQRLN